MKFVTDIKEEEYEKFVSNNIYKSHFLQSYKWGVFAQKEKHFINNYVGMVDESNNLLCATLLLEKKLPLGYSYFYAPRGYVINFEDFELLKYFTNSIKDYAKKKKGIFIKIDPDIIINQEDYEGNKVNIKYDGMKIFDSLRKLGYHHLGFTKNFETNQPRYTFRIDMNNSLEEIEDRFSKTTKQRIKKAEDLEVEVILGTKDNVKNFYSLMDITENRKDFVSHSLRYYETLYEIFNKDNLCNIFLGIVHIDKILDKQSIILSEVNNELESFNGITNLSKTQNTKKSELLKRSQKLSEDIIRYSEIQKEYGSRIIINAHFIIEYGDKAWVLYAGNHNILTDTYGNYLTYKNHIEYYYNKGTKIYDQFGTIGDLENKNLIGLHEFKKKFGGDYIEFIGEFDLITNKIMYVLFTKVIPLYRKVIKGIAKNKRKKHEVN